VEQSSEEELMASTKLVVPVIRSKPEDRPVIPLIRELLGRLGEDPQRDGLLQTPRRVGETLQFLTSGYSMDVHQIVNGALYEVKYDEIVVVKDIEFFSLCEHHLLPFFGRAHVSYVPNGKIVGLSKIPRLVEMYSRRLQVQERLTNEIARAIEKVLQPRGVAVIIEARHLCMMMRGVQKQNSYAISSAMLGEFESDPKTRAEFVQLIHNARVA
jgi:GTP cyclohydrolase I